MGGDGLERKGKKKTPGQHIKKSIERGRIKKKPTCRPQQFDKNLTTDLYSIV